MKPVHRAKGQTNVGNETNKIWWLRRKSTTTSQTALAVDRIKLTRAFVDDFDGVASTYFW